MNIAPRKIFRWIDFQSIRKIFRLLDSQIFGFLNIRTSDYLIIFFLNIRTSLR